MEYQLFVWLIRPGLSKDLIVFFYTTYYTFISREQTCGINIFIINIFIQDFPIIPRN